MSVGADPVGDPPNSMPGGGPGTITRPSVSACRSSMPIWNCWRWFLQSSSTMITRVCGARASLHPRGRWAGGGRAAQRRDVNGPQVRGLFGPIGRRTVDRPHRLGLAADVGWLAGTWSPGADRAGPRGRDGPRGRRRRPARRVRRLGDDPAVHRGVPRPAGLSDLTSPRARADGRRRRRPAGFAREVTPTRSTRSTSATSEPFGGERAPEPPCGAELVDAPKGVREPGTMTRRVLVVGSGIAGGCQPLSASGTPVSRRRRRRR